MRIAMCGGPGGVIVRGERTRGLPGNLGGADVSGFIHPVGQARTTKARSGVGRVPRAGSETSDAGVGTAKRGKPSGMVGMDVSGQSVCTVPTKRGNLPEGSPWRESGRREARGVKASHHRIVVRKDDEDTDL